MITCVCGLSFGDCGKGKIIDILCPDYDFVVRYAGGPNAGHTLVVDGTRTVFHHLPSSYLRNESTSVMAAGMVADPLKLAAEIKALPSSQYGSEGAPRLAIDKKIHCILPWHIIQDREMCAEEIGTTCSGIGPAYADKCMRVSAIRLESLLPSIVFEAGGRWGGFRHLFDSYKEAFNVIAPFLCDTGELLRDAVRDKKNILFEGAQGIHLDVDFGDYPYVTSTGVGPSAIPQACALPNLHLDRIVGVIKTYATRVGEGNLKTELIGDGDEYAKAAEIRKLGGEYGATTGRKRRIGWLNLDQTRMGIALTGATEICVNHCDTAAKLSFPLKVFTYGRYLEMEEFDDISSPSGRRFIEFLEKELDRPIKMLGVGPDRQDVVFR